MKHSTFTLFENIWRWKNERYLCKINNLRFEEDSDWLIGLVGRVFASGPGDLGSIPGCVIPKTLKMVLDTSLLTLSNIRYVSRVKWSNPRKGVAPSLTPRCSSYWKGSLLVALECGHQLLLLLYSFANISKIHDQDKDRMESNVITRVSQKCCNFWFVLVCGWSISSHCRYLQWLVVF